MKTALVTLLLCLSAVAFAVDKSVTYLTAGSKVVSLSADLNTPGIVNLAVCGQAPISGSGGLFGPVTCYQASLSSGGVFTTISNFAANGALTFWQGREGL